MPFAPHVPQDGVESSASAGAWTPAFGRHQRPLCFLLAGPLTESSLASKI